MRMTGTKGFWYQIRQNVKMGGSSNVTIYVNLINYGSEHIGIENMFRHNYVIDGIGNRFY